MRVIGVQLDIAWEDKRASFARVQTLLRGAPLTDQTLIVLPEMFATGFSLDVQKTAEETGGPTLRFVSELARQTGSYVLAGVVTAAGQGRARNEAVVVDSHGAEIARYCKLHPFTYGRESEHFDAGREPVLFECHGFQAAPFICYDLRFPEIFRSAARGGAQLMAVIANWPSQRAAHWTVLLQARAIENQAYVIGVNRSGADPHLTYRGGSLIIDPHGQILAQADESPSLIVADLELAPLVDYRRQFPALRDMRPDFVPPGA